MSFSTSILGCCTDPGNFILSWFGLPLVTGKNAEAIGENGTLWALSTFTPCSRAFLRAQIRKNQGIDGETFIILDWLEKHLFKKAICSWISWRIAAAHAAQYRKRRATWRRLIISPMIPSWTRRSSLAKVWRSKRWWSRGFTWHTTMHFFWTKHTLLQASHNQPIKLILYSSRFLRHRPTGSLFFAVELTCIVEFMYRLMNWFDVRVSKNDQACNNWMSFYILNKTALSANEAFNNLQHPKNASNIIDALCSIKHEG